MLTERLFYYLRHGETDWNRDGRMQGHADIPLNETGRVQAERAVAPLSSCGIATICCSPLSRARETAQIVGQGLGLPVTVIDGLKECGLGVGEGQAPGPWYYDWRAGGPLDGAERYDEFLARVLAALNRALGYPGPVLIVGHGGAYRTVKIHAALDDKFRIRNGIPIRHDPPAGAGACWSMTDIPPD